MSCGTSVSTPAWWLFIVRGSLWSHICSSRLYAENKRLWPNPEDIHACMCVCVCVCVCACTCMRKDSHILKSTHISQDSQQVTVELRIHVHLNPLQLKLSTSSHLKQNTSEHKRRYIQNLTSIDGDWHLLLRSPGTKSRGRLMFSASTLLSTASVPDVSTERSSKPRQVPQRGK